MAIIRAPMYKFPKNAGGRVLFCGRHMRDPRVLGPYQVIRSLSFDRLGSCALVLTKEIPMVDDRNPAWPHIDLLYQERICICMHVCMYIYIYMHICIYLYLHIQGDAGFLASAVWPLILIWALTLFEGDSKLGAHARRPQDLLWNEVFHDQLLAQGTGLSGIGHGTGMPFPGRVQPHAALSNRDTAHRCLESLVAFTRLGYKHDSYQPLAEATRIALNPHHVWIGHALHEWCRHIQTLYTAYPS